MALMFYQFSSFISTGTFTLGTAAACVVLAIMIYLLFRPAPKYNGEIQIKDAADVTE